MSVEGTKIMSDYIHKCLKCDNISYYLEKGVYVCSVCGFVWEIKKVKND